MSTKTPPEPVHVAVVDTACPLDCPDSCSLTVTTENRKVVKIDGSHRHAVTAGYICAKVRRFGERVYHDGRVQFPMRRRGPKGRVRFERATWDEALDEIATRMRSIKDEFGGEAVLPFSYGGSNGLLTQDTTDALLFRRFGASRLERTVCAAPTGAASLALYGKMPSTSYEDYPHARLIVMWGANPSTSGIHLVPYVRQAQRNGAQLIVVDPRRTPLARHADVHIQLRPGTDLVVALAIHRYLFESGRVNQEFLAQHTTGADRLRERAQPWTFERAADVSGVPADVLERFAQTYADASPALVRCGWGLERNRNGGSAAMAVLALPAVGAKFGVRGGGFAMSNSNAWTLGPAREAWTNAKDTNTRLVNMNLLGRALLEYDAPPVKMLFVYNCNPAATIPDQTRVVRGLEREDLFTVVFDQVMTDTAAYADLVLPATTFLESYDIARSYGPISLQLTTPVIDAVGEARCNTDVFAELVRRLDLSEPGDPADDLEMMLKVLETLPDRVAQGLREGEPAAPPSFGREPVQFVDVFPWTNDAKVHLFSEALDRTAPAGLYGYQPDPATAAYPLALISPASDKTISSTLGELRDRIASLVIHPDDAAARGISDGDVVRVFNERGEVRCYARVSGDVCAGTAAMPKGLWRKHTLNGLTSNALAPDSLTDIAGGACFNDARVQVERIESPPPKVTSRAMVH